MLEPENVKAAADILFEAYRSRRLIDELPQECTPRDLPASYAIQAALVARITDENPGWKIGMTTLAAQQARGMTEPVFACLLPEKLMSTTGKAYGGWSRQMLEAEFVFELGEDLPRRGDRDYTVDEVRAAVAVLYPAIEVCGSRINQPSPPLYLTLADNSSHNALVLGRAIPNWRRIDYAAVEVRVEVDGGTSVAGSGRNVLGDPINALRWLASVALPFGGLKKGHLIASGACAVLPVERGPLRCVADFGRFGTITAELSAPDPISTAN